jgi:transketolase
MDAVQAANSGHPGMPMGMADAATVLWTRFLVHDPANPTWFDRDRFVLSAGHGSMLLYSLLHLSGYDLSLDDIKAFRQWDSKTPGHPEVGHTPGVETTTGPLGQGFANGVGMAMAERYMRETFGEDLCDHWTYAIVSDGDLMEGVAYEAASMAGHLKLGRMVYLYDDNEITIDGSTDLSFTEDVLARLKACGWHVQRVDGHDAEAIAAAIEAARSETERPSLISCRTTIGWGSPSFEGTSRTHGAPLGDDEVAATKTRLGLDPTQTFHVDDSVYGLFQGHDGAAQRAAWTSRLNGHARAAELTRWLDNDIAAVFDDIDWPSFEVGKNLATRKASAACLKAVAAKVPWLIGGSADLAGSNGVSTGQPVLSPTRFAGAPQIHFGVREHAMAAACNGISLHGGLRPFNATFLVFHDYHRPSVRLSAMMEQPVVYVYTHDSIFLGEDGPTHQPVATLLSLRALPGIEVWRPADAYETTVAWKESLRRSKAPTALILSRQGLKTMAPRSEDMLSKGGYVAHDSDGEADVCLLATGSEVGTCIEAAQVLARHGVAARVVSLPCRERFAKQSKAYQDEVCPPSVPKVSVEAALTIGWERWTGTDGLQLGIDRFGASAPASVLAEQFGFTPDIISSKVRDFLSAR